MEEIIIRFPVLAQEIFKNLDDKSLAKSKSTSRVWYSFMDTEKFYWHRIIKKYSNSFDLESFINTYASTTLNGVGDDEELKEEAYIKFKKSWQVVMEKTGINMVKELGLAIKHF